MQNRPVVAIPPSYDLDERLELESTVSYLNYLYDKGATSVMTTAGTSQFNLLDTSEIHALNTCISENFEGEAILGIPATSSVGATKFVQAAQSYINDHTHLMALYPDRFYDQETIINYITSICDSLGDGVYLHAPKMRSGYGGDWNYNADTINKMHDKGLVKGIKEEHSSLSDSYNFISQLNDEIDVIVAGGSMRRFSFLESAGANSFLSGVGNLFPEIENKFLIDSGSRQKCLDLETKFFNVSMKYGWHKSLRCALRCELLTCFYDRQPWPKDGEDFCNDIYNILKELQNEK
jgi:dihydrodipicolinate synthase/N-acetylneuraminate lyase